MNQACHIILTGKVQGVCFRVFVNDNALKLKIKGWVKNKDQNKVEITAIGDEDKLKKFIALCTLGPTTAKVENVEIQRIVSKKFSDFSIR